SNQHSRKPLPPHGSLSTNFNTRAGLQIYKAYNNIIWVFDLFEIYLWWILGDQVLGNVGYSYKLGWVTVRFVMIFASFGQKSRQNEGVVCLVHRASPCAEVLHPLRGFL